MGSPTNLVVFVTLERSETSRKGEGDLSLADLKGASSVLSKVRALKAHLLQWKSIVGQRGSAEFLAGVFEEEDITALLSEGQCASRCEGGHKLFQVLEVNFVAAEGVLNRHAQQNQTASRRSSKEVKVDVGKTPPPRALTPLLLWCTLPCIWNACVLCRAFGMRFVMVSLVSQQGQLNYGAPCYAAVACSRRQLSWPCFGCVLSRRRQLCLVVFRLCAYTKSFPPQSFVLPFVIFFFFIIGQLPTQPSELMNGAFRYFGPR